MKYCFQELHGLTQLKEEQKTPLCKTLEFQILQEKQLLEEIERYNENKTQKDS